MSNVVTSFKDNNNQNPINNYAHYKSERRMSRYYQQVYKAQVTVVEDEDDDEEKSLSEVEKITKNNKRCLYLCLVIKSSLSLS